LSSRKKEGKKEVVLDEVRETSRLKRKKVGGDPGEGPTFSLCLQPGGGRQGASISLHMVGWGEGKGEGGGALISGLGEGAETLLLAKKERG